MILISASVTVSVRESGYISDEEFIFSYDGKVIGSIAQLIMTIERSFINQFICSDSMMKSFNHRSSASMINSINK